MKLKQTDHDLAASVAQTFLNRENKHDGLEGDRMPSFSFMFSGTINI